MKFHDVNLISNSKFILSNFYSSSNFFNLFELIIYFINFEKFDHFFNLTFLDSNFPRKKERRTFFYSFKIIILLYSLNHFLTSKKIKISLSIYFFFQSYMTWTHLPDPSWLTLFFNFHKIHLNSTKPIISNYKEPPLSLLFVPFIIN